MNWRKEMYCIENSHNFLLYMKEKFCSFNVRDGPFLDVTIKHIDTHWKKIFVQTSSKKGFYSVTMMWMCRLELELKLDVSLTLMHYHTPCIFILVSHRYTTSRRRTGTRWMRWNYIKYILQERDSRNQKCQRTSCVVFKNKV